MTTRQITISPLGTARVGREQISVTAHTVAGGGFDWHVYRASNDSWWEGCGNCSADSGTKPWFGHVYNGVCFQCGGTGVRRMAGSEKAMVVKIRRRITSRLGKLNAAEKAEERALAVAGEWQKNHPDIAHHLHRIREQESGGVLVEMGMKMLRWPLSDKQVAYAEALLRERAYAEAFPEDERVWVGSVKERITVTGTLTTVHTLHNERYGTNSMLLILQVPQGPHAVAMVKMQTSAAFAFSVQRGDTLTVTGRVKEHTEHATFGRQTVIVRPQQEEQ